ncbi:hypothetical protein ACJX0J_020896, partial [Zea mays]
MIDPIVLISNQYGIKSFGSSIQILSLIFLAHTNILKQNHVLGHLMFHYIITKFSINCCIFGFSRGHILPSGVTIQSKILHNIECEYIQHLFFLSIHSIRVKKCTSISSAVGATSCNKFGNCNALAEEEALVVNACYSDNG